MVGFTSELNSISDTCCFKFNSVIGKRLKIQNNFNTASCSSHIRFNFIERGQYVIKLCGKFSIFKTIKDNARPAEKHSRRF